MAKSTKSGLGRGLNSLLGAYEEGLPEEPRSQVNDSTAEFEPSPEKTSSRARSASNVSRETFDAGEQHRFVGEDDVAEENVKIRSVVHRNVGEVPIDSVSPNPDQPRTNFKREEIEELAASIEKDGLLQPILVRTIGVNSYQIIAGERRWQACRLIGLKTVPVRIKEVDDDKALELALIENVQRSDLNPIEEAYGYRRLMERKNMTQADVAQAMSKGRSTVANALRLLDLPEAAQQLLFEEKITAGHARAILSIPTKEGRQKLAERMVEEKLSVREAEMLARLLSGQKSDEEKPARTPVPLSFKKVAKALREVLNTNVKVKSSKGKNKIEIEFQDESDLERLFEELIASVS